MYSGVKTQETNAESSSPGLFCYWRTGSDVDARQVVTTPVNVCTGKDYTNRSLERDFSSHQDCKGKPHRVNIILQTHRSKTVICMHPPRSKNNIWQVRIIHSSATLVPLPWSPCQAPQKGIQQAFNIRTPHVLNAVKAPKKAGEAT